MGEEERNCECVRQNRFVRMREQVSEEERTGERGRDNM